jgi:SAM-dependent methyltransferase
MTPTSLEVTLDQQIVTSTTGALELFAVYLGERLGLYEALRDGKRRTASELARDAGIHPRYAREWLEQQAVAGYLVVDEPDAAADARRYSLPSANLAPLADPAAVDHVAPLARMIVAIARVLDHVAAAYQSGGGVPYARYGSEFRSGQGAINRPAFTTALVEEWLPAVPGLTARLGAGGRVADVGCGQGWSTTAVARAFPKARVLGIDNDVASIDEARSLARDAGVSTVRFEAVDASELAAEGPFDVVLLLEALHDLSRPAEVLRAIGSSLAEGGSLIVADEAVAPRFHAPGDEVERMMYGWSITHCLPAAMADTPSAATGTVLREGALRELAVAAGFGCVEVLPVDGGFFRIYRLTTHTSSVSGR